MQSWILKPDQTHDRVLDYSRTLEFMQNAGAFCSRREFLLNLGFKEIAQRYDYSCNCDRFIFENSSANWQVELVSWWEEWEEKEKSQIKDEKLEKRYLEYRLSNIEKLLERFLVKKARYKDLKEALK